MKRLIAIMMVLCLTLSVCCFAASAADLPLSSDGCGMIDRSIYFVNNGFEGDIYIYCWNNYDGYSFEWPGVQMDYYGVNVDGEDVYHYDLPYEYNYYIISDSNWLQTCDILYDEEPVLVTLTDKINEMGHYVVNTTALNGRDPLDPTKPVDTHVEGDSVVVLENTKYGMTGGAFSDPIYICCRTNDENGATIHAEMELIDTNEFDEPVYRFIVPKGMKYYYVTDGKKRSREYTVKNTDHIIFDRTIDENGYYDAIHYIDMWGADPYLFFEESHSVFDRFREEYKYSTEVFSRYDELYTHKDKNGDMDWKLCCIEPDMDALVPDLWVYTSIVGNRYIENATNLFYPFPSYYAIYDAAQDTFVPLDSDNADNYDDLTRVFDEIGTGRLFGDLDGDDCISVIDVTVFQRCEAQMRYYPDDDETYDDYMYYYAHTYYFSDFNRDGNRDIVDATCIQRYLAKLPYKIG